MKAILETKDLVKYYGSGDNLVKAIDHTDIRVEPGEFVAVVGRSGSGKSTLLHMLGGLDRPDSGKVLVEGRDIFRLKDDRLAVFRRRKIGFIFQSYNLVPSLNVWENIVLPHRAGRPESGPGVCDGHRAKDRHVRPAPRPAGHPVRGTAAAGGHRQGPGLTPGHHPGR